MNSFDLIVIGTGVAGSTVATTCRDAGWSVAIIDERPFGGTCALRGCDPKKVLRRGAELVDALRRFKGKGVGYDNLSIQWEDLINFKRTFTDPVPENKEKHYTEEGIAPFHGTASFTGEKTLEVNHTELRADHIVIASGAEPIPLDIPGSEYLVSSDQFLELESLPERVLFVGGGYIAFEFAHIAARADRTVIILEQGEKPLTAFDPDLVDRLLSRSRNLGIQFHANTAASAIEKKGDAFIVHASVGDARQSFEADLVVHGAGRAPAIAKLKLENGNVQAGKKGIEVNEYLQSVSNPAVYAAGDASDTAGPPLTPVAGLEGESVAHNLMKGNQSKPDYRGIPSVVFTIPALARVGLLESEAQEKGLNYDCRFFDMSDWFSAQRVAEPDAAAKVLIGRDSDEVIGAHLFGHGCSELINYFALAIQLNLPASELKKLVTAYPTITSDLEYLL